MTQEHPFEQRQSLQDYFKVILHTVVGQAFTAAGYERIEEPLKWLGGRFRYVKQFDDGHSAYIEFQVLVYNANEWIGKQPSRFTVTLLRNERGNPHNQFQRSLSQLVVNDFGVAILPSADYWWTFNDTETLGKALAEAGHLIIGYGIPFLAGELKPGDSA